MTTLVNRAKMTTATTGTGTITLGSASLGYQTFAAAGVNNGNVVSYVIEDGANWEIGRGTYTSTGTTLTRAVIQSSNAGSPITLSGSAVVFISAIDFDIVPYDKDSGTPYIAITDGGTGANTAANARTSLGLGTIATQDASAVAITGGTINGTTVGSTTRAAVNATNINANDASVISVSSTSPALTVTQTGAGASILVEDDTSPDSTPFIVGATGSVGIGTSTLTGLLNLYAASNSTLYLTGDAATAAVVSRASSDASAANVNFRKFRGSTAAPAAVTSGDLIGVTNYTAWDGVTVRAAAQIVGAVDTFAGSDNVSGVLTFHTRPTGAAAALTERLRIGPDGNVTFKNAITETIFALTGTTPALSAANGTIQTWTLTANSTPTDSLSNGQSITLLIDDGTAYTITWPSVTWKTNGGVAPTLNTTGVTVIVLWEVGGVLYGARVGDA